MAYIGMGQNILLADMGDWQNIFTELNDAEVVKHPHNTLSNLQKTMDMIL